MLKNERKEHQKGEEGGTKMGKDDVDVSSGTSLVGPYPGPNPRGGEKGESGIPLKGELEKRSRGNENTLRTYGLCP